MDAAKGALGAVGNLTGGIAGKVGATGAAALGAGAALVGAGASAGTSSTGGGDDGVPPMAARLDEAARRRPSPGFLLPLLGVAGLGFLAYFGFQTIAQGEGTLFKKAEVAPVAAVAPAAPAIPSWLSAIGDTLKATFAWLTLGINGTSVIASGEADTQEIKDNALKAITLAVKATPEGANSDVIDNIKVKGATDTPVGAALAALGTNPNVAACNTAFATTMAGRTINFSTGGASISADNASLLNTLTAVANACKAHKIDIGGHTDTVGKPENNQALSQKRAEAVKAYWTGKGVAEAGLVATGYGETKLIEATPDQTANEKNRRIEFTVTDAAAAVPAPVEPAK
jgi:outer membrane protein OmpA-like peptidoglycan-associated protein